MSAKHENALAAGGDGDKSVPAPFILLRITVDVTFCEKSSRFRRHVALERCRLDLRRSHPATGDKVAEML